MARPPTYTFTYQARDASDGLETVRLVQRLRPDVAILDIGMPLLNGIAAASTILRESPATQPILLTMYTDDVYVFEAFRAGVRGYVVKGQMADDLLMAIRKVASGGIYISTVAGSWSGSTSTTRSAWSASRCAGA